MGISTAKLLICLAPLCLITYSDHHTALSSPVMGLSNKIFLASLILVLYLQQNIRPSSQNKYKTYDLVSATLTTMFFSLVFVRVSRLIFPPIPSLRTLLTFEGLFCINVTIISGTSFEIPASMEWMSPSVTNALTLR